MRIGRLFAWLAASKFPTVLIYLCCESHALRVLVVVGKHIS